MRYNSQSFNSILVLLGTCLSPAAAAVIYESATLATTRVKKNAAHFEN